MVRKIKLISGEILKEPLLDVFLTDLELISFSLLCPRPPWRLSFAEQAEDLRGLAQPEGECTTETVVQALAPEHEHPDSNVPAGGGARSFTPEPRRVFASQTRPGLEGSPLACSAKLSSQPTYRRLANQNVVPAIGGNRNVVPGVEEEEASQQITLSVKIGDYVHCGDKIGALHSKASGSRRLLSEAEQELRSAVGSNRNMVPVIIGDSGRVITLTKAQLTLQKTQPVLFYSEATSHVRENEWVQRGSPILTLTHQTLVTGDIVQGIPRIEQLFEAVTSSSSALPDDEPLYETLHSQAREIFRRNWSLVPLPTAVRQALEEIQQIIVESIQKVYLSQGVLIADKHIEIIVKQMTSKGQIIDNGNTGFIINEVLPLQKIENANLTTSGKKAVYAPAVVGLTRAALNSDSFVSAASFQETTRVLTRDAVAGKSDFLRGLKEKVVIGDLISAGTGLDLFFLYTLLAENIFDTTCEKMSGQKKPRPNKYESSIRRI